ncbi:MAG: helix-turn-helix transcriptional regulator [Clostridia bacterium]|nr:helix-turn-helix transcriptional regulator [Clostridia bacterium]
MRYITVSSLPNIRFAHSYEADVYDRCLHQDNRPIEILYVTEGYLEMFYCGEHFIANKGDILCMLYESDPIMHSAAYHSHRTVGFSIDYTQSDTDSPGALLLPGVTPVCPQSEDCQRLMMEIARMNSLYPEDTICCGGLFLQLLSKLNNINRTALAPNKEYLYVKRAKKFIYDRIGVPIRQRDVAQHLGITPEYLCAVFKKSEGIPIMRFINSVKLTNVRSLMEKEGLSLAQASQLYGYSDPNYVSRLYKQYFHINITDAVQKYPYTNYERYKIRLPLKTESNNNS